MKLQYFDYLMGKADSLQKTLMLGKIERKKKKKKRVGRKRWLDNITESENMNLSKLWEIVKYREA